MMRTAISTSLSALLLLLAPVGLAGLARAAEYHQSTPREGQGPLPLSALYLHPVRGKSTYYGNYMGGGSCGLDQPDGSAIPKEVGGCVCGIGWL